MDPGGERLTEPRHASYPHLRTRRALGSCRQMFHDPQAGPRVTAAEARYHLGELETERAIAVVTGVARIESYMGDLESELEAWRRLYTIEAVTEIATLRAELFGAEVG